ncbi:helix-turn-helix domain-containing protein [Streptomyces solicathayae]|uniref:Pyridoxamine 5'-phosphate oxidase family protein n=1 Tax=Streptomyces solicathayae TaxID=3081768 RepID=A0ABZ0LL59_9ACTN|nr:pyridoxamine 5'-phosphate oxidase family protein [Streptomyces sp. HUAS YS2]WOX20237.1 pyridoxamine 5'-phosphate oxidase family protein [Streptomyces sp. HUAS YS2]
MDRETQSPRNGAPHPRGDIGRRVAARRHELGLSREELALRAGSAPGYIQYLEEQPATPGVAFLLRLADALETTVPVLTGAIPGGRPYTALLRTVELDAAECWDLLDAHGLGRIALTTPDGPAVLPVNYLVTDGEVAFRSSSTSTSTRSGSSARPTAAGPDVAFEADHIDEMSGQGWSVLLVGPVHDVTDPTVVERLAARADGGPWTGGEDSHWTLLAPRRVTGRRILLAGS